FFAWRRIWHPAATCRPGEACALPQVETTYKALVWLVAALVAIAPRLPHLAPWFSREHIPTKRALLAFAIVVATSSPAWSAPKTVTLSVPDMNCAACPITVKKALGKVAGVARTEVNLEKREATVTFDDARTNVDALTRATRDAGYP